MEPNIFTLGKDGDLERFRYECIKCGNCCRNTFDIHLSDEDLLNWRRAGKKEFLQHIQIDPSSISPGYNDVYSRLVQKYGKKAYKIINMEENTFNLLKNIKLFDQNKHDERINMLKKFILKTHDFQGEGMKDIDFPHDFLPGYGYRAIFSPKSFKIVFKGERLGLKYILIMERRDECEFLSNNLCSIHNYKPLTCKGYPFVLKKITDLKDFERRMEKALSICKGFKQIN